MRHQQPAQVHGPAHQSDPAQNQQDHQGEDGGEEHDEVIARRRPVFTWRRPHFIQPFNFPSWSRPQTAHPSVRLSPHQCSPVFIIYMDVFARPVCLSRLVLSVVLWWCGCVFWKVFSFVVNINNMHTKILEQQLCGNREIIDWFNVSECFLARGLSRMILDHMVE